MAVGLGEVAAKLRAQNKRLRDALVAAEAFIADDTCRHDSEKVGVLVVVKAALEGGGW
jgi:hypothetical protein